MKKTFLIVLINLTFAFAGQAIAQCPTGNVTLVSQADVDAFAANYPACTQIGGNFLIGNNSGGQSDIYDLTALQNLTTVSGNFTVIATAALTSLQGIDNITFVEGNLVIANNLQLASLNGLEKITAIDGYIQIIGNSVLTSIEGMKNIAASSVNTFLFISDNPQLSMCSYTNICNVISDASVYKYIENNSGTCLNEATATAACAFADIKGIREETNLLIYEQSGDYYLKAVRFNIKSVNVFDVTGKILCNNENIHQSLFQLPETTNIFLLIRVITDDDKIFLKKLLKLY